MRFGGLGVERSDTPVHRRALRWNAANTAYPSANLGRPKKLSMCRACGRGDALVDQRATKVIGSGLEASRGKGRTLLDPRSLDVVDRSLQHQARDGVGAENI